MGFQPVLLGELAEYKPGSDVNIYLKHVEGFFALNEEVITENQQPLLFLNAMGTEPFERVQWASKKKANELTFDELKTILRDIYEPIRIVQVERARFANRKRRAAEPIMDFLWQLQKLADNCEFGDFLEEQIKSQFIIGIKCENTLSELLALPEDATLAQTVNKARVTELIEKNSQLMTDSHEFAPTSVNWACSKDQPKQSQRFPASASARPLKTGPNPGRYMPYAAQRRCFRCSSVEHQVRDCYKHRSARNSTPAPQNHHRRHQSSSFPKAQSGTSWRSGFQQHNDSDRKDDSEQESDIESCTADSDLKEALHNIFDSDEDEALNKIVEGDTSTATISTADVNSQSAQPPRVKHPKASVPVAIRKSARIAAKRKAKKKK